MKTQIISLETHDDLISVRDRMSWAKSPRILLVWPRYEKVSLRPVDLRVLQQHARFLGADLGLVTRRASVRHDAESFGIPVFDTTAAAQRDAWPPRRTTERHEFWAEKPDLRAMREDARLKEAHWRSTPPARVGFFAVGVLAVLAVAGLFVPRATIKLTPVSEMQSLTLPVTADTSISSVRITGSLPAHAITITIAGTQAAEVTSRTSIPVNKASGVARFTNLGQSPVTIPAGTVVYSVGSAPVRFLTQNMTHLPGNVNAVVEVPITAAEAGKVGNLPADSIQAVEGGLGLSVSVTNPEPTSGGTDRMAVAPSNADRQRVHDVLLPLLQKRAEDQIRSSIGNKDALLLDTLKMGKILDETYDPPAGQAGNLVKLTLRAEFSAQYIKADDLTQLARTTLDASVPEGFMAAPDTLTFQVMGSPTLDTTGSSHFDLQIGQTVVHQLDASRANELVRGLRPVDAARRLKSKLAIAKEPEILLSPPWWPWLPLIPFRVEVK